MSPRISSRFLTRFGSLAAVAAVLSLAPAAFAGPVTVVKGGPSRKAARAQLVGALEQLGGALAVCFRSAPGDRVRVELAVARNGRIERATQKSRGAVAQCAAGVLAVQKLPAVGAYTVVVDLAPGQTDSMEAIKRQLIPHRARLQGCYDKVAAKHPGLAGAVKLGFLIRPDGRIVDPQIQESTLSHAGVERCLVDTIGKARLEARPGGKTIAFSIALSFSGGQGGSAAPTAGGLRPSKDGPVPAAELSRVMNQHKGRFSACYDAQAKKRPDLAGRVVLRFTVRDNGTVRNVKIKQSTLGDRKVEQCIVKVGESLSFTPRPGKGKTRVIYPFEFSRK